jgi:hypothetical protein
VAMSEEICQFILCLEGEKYAEIYWCSKRQKVPTLAECLQCSICPPLLFCNFYLYISISISRVELDGSPVVWVNFFLTLKNVLS